jgi:hypothetical protein
MTSITPSVLAFLEADPVVFRPGHEGGPADLFGEIQANETRMEFGLCQIDYPKGDATEPRRDSMVVLS